MERIIDFHTHIFPDKMAVKTVEFLAERGGIPAYADGTLADIQAKADEANVTLSISLPVLTKPESFDSVLNFAKTINEGREKGEHRIMSFAGIHPDCTDIEEKMAKVKESGCKGVKLHPDYQQIFIDDERMLRIFNAAIDQDLIVVTHAGLDVGYPECTHSTPRRTAMLLDKLKGEAKLILAHMGGCRMHQEVYDILAGRNVYFDTSYVLDEMDGDMLLKTLEKHGADKIVFASDCPWKTPKMIYDKLTSFGLSKQTLAKILYQNAEKLLGDI